MAKTIIIRSIRRQRGLYQFSLCTFIAALAMATWPVASFGQQLGACYDPASGKARNYQHAYSLMVSRSDTASARQRLNLGLPTLAANQVQIVSDTTVCRTASVAYDAAANVSYPAQPVVVLALGSTRRIVIKDVGFRGAALNLLFDQNFATLLKRIGL